MKTNEEEVVAMTIGAGRRRAVILGWMAILIGAMGSAASAGNIIDLDFSQTSSLPSGTGQSLDYFGSAGVSESSVFSVSNHVLNIDTYSVDHDVYAYYQLSPGYDHTLDAELEFKILVSKTTPGYGQFGVELGFNDANASAFLFVNPTGWMLYGTSVHGTFANPAVFHTFDLKTTASTNGYVLSIDGVEQATGQLSGGYSGSAVYFGDGTPTGGNVLAQLADLHYSNPSRAVPEPASLVLLGSSLLGLVGYGLHRKAKVAA